MNKVFKIVWSKSKQCYVVVSEYAKSNGGKKKVLATVLAGLMMAGVAGGLAPQQALAGDDYSNSAINIEPNGLYPAYRNKGVNKNAIAIGAARIMLQELPETVVLLSVSGIRPAKIRP